MSVQLPSYEEGLVLVQSGTLFMHVYVHGFA